MTPLSRRTLVRGAAVAVPLSGLALPAPSGALAPRVRSGSGAGCATDDRLATLLAKDMEGKHAGLMHGVPLSYNWAEGPRVGVGNRPGVFRAVSAWGQVYESADGSPATNVRVSCRNISLWLLSRSTGHWREVNDSKAVNGANYVEDFSGNANKPAALRSEAGGAVSATLGGGYNFHLYSTRPRADIDPSDVGGVVCIYSARVIMDDPAGPDERHLARYLASAGADYWLDGTISAAPGTVADVGIGKARWVAPTWTTYTMSTIPFRKLARTRPPVCLRGR